MRRRDLSTLKIGADTPFIASSALNSPRSGGRRASSYSILADPAYPSQLASRIPCLGTKVGDDRYSSDLLPLRPLGWFRIFPISFLYTQNATYERIEKASILTKKGSKPDFSISFSHLTFLYPFLYGMVDRICISSSCDSFGCSPELILFSIVAVSIVP